MSDRSRKVLGWLYFIALQLANIPLWFIGLFVVAIFQAQWLTKKVSAPYVPPYAKSAPTIRYFKGGKFTYLWNNDEDGKDGQGHYGTFYWSSIRNPVNNLRFACKWVGGPYWKYTWRSWYVECGWN